MENPNPNPNLNIQMISIEPREHHIVVFMRVGVTTGVDQYIQQGKSKVRPTTQKKSPLDA